MWNDNEFNSTFSSPGGKSKEMKKNMIRHIVPVTGYIINACEQVAGENSIFEFKEMTFHQIYFIGIIRSIVKRANDITYMIDDMTSTDINVKLQSDEDDDDMEKVEQNDSEGAANPFMENQYVKVFGTIKSLQGQKNVHAFRIMHVRDLNAVTHHILECINSSIHYIAKANGDHLGDMTSNSNPLKNVNSSGDGDLNKQIEEFIKQCRSNEGMHIKDVCKYFKDIPEYRITAALEFLSTEGHVYSTIDEDHFKSTEQ